MKQQNIIEKMKKTPLVFDGAMGTEIYKRGVFINACFDELNLTNPKLIKSIHEDYIKAGADVILTNTFGANLFKLEKFALADKIYEINYRGAKLAKEAAASQTPLSPCGRGAGGEGYSNIYVLGSIGPCFNKGSVITLENIEKIKESYKIQIKALKEGGIDGVIFETYHNLEELDLAACIAKSEGLSVIASLAVTREHETLDGLNIKQAVTHLDKNNNVNAIGFNCIIGAHAMLSMLEDAINLTSKPFIAQPNAGEPQNIEGRMIYMTSPEYFTEYCQNYIRLGVRGAGGCCGISPDHIKNMSRTVKALTGVKQHVKIDKIQTPAAAEIKITPKEEKSRFAKKIFSGQKVSSIEITPPRSIILDDMIEKVKMCKAAGVDTVNIPDGPRASSRISPLAAAIILERETGMETILHYCCRDRNLIGMQSDLLGACAAGLKNCLIITGDPPKLGGYPDASAVFDVDAVGLIKTAHNLNNGADIAGNIINPPCSLFIGAGANPCAIDIEKELNHLYNKFEAGAEFIMTQPVFEPDALFSFLEKAHKKGIDIPVIAGIWPLVSLRNALFLKNEVPGIIMPEKILEKMEKAQTKEDGIKIGTDISRGIRDKIAPYVQGYQVNAPFGRIEAALGVLK